MGQDCDCGHCDCGKNNTKTPEEKVEDLKKAIKECGFEVEQDGEEIKIEIPE
jgi:hypothetical protein